MFVNMTLVSICIPTFNGEQYVRTALNCIIEQTYSNLEIVFSDDGSSDGTLEILENFARDSLFSVKVLKHQHTSLAGNWNHCVANASGEYIKFLFQDDLMRPDCISKLVRQALADPEIGLVFSSRDLIVESAETLGDAASKIVMSCASLHRGWSDLQPVQEGLKLLADPALVDGVWNKVGEPSTVLIKKQCLIDVGGFDPSLCQLIDLDMWYRLMAVSKVGFVDEVLSSFRIHGQQVSVENTNSGRAGDDSRFFARKVVHSPLFDNLHPVAQKKLLKASRPPSAFKVQRRRLKRWLVRDVLRLRS
jgi:glycosyltransferase involved in cell wall biosynthesis